MVDTLLFLMAVVCLATMAAVAFGAAGGLFWLLLPAAEREWVPPVETVWWLLAVLAAFISANVGLRWLRWQFLCRRFGLRLRAKDSLRLYLATLPAIATPLYVGELIRGLAISRRHP